MSTLTYIRNFLKDRYVASITPTSRAGVDSICRKIDLEAGRVFVEYGPGTGVISKGILERMRPDAELILIERNAHFVGVLQEALADSRVHIHHDSAQHVRRILREQGIGPADAIVSGIPFSWLSATQRDHIVRDTYEALRPGGKFIAYQTFWQSDEHLLKHLWQYFDEVNTGIEMLNAPPMRIYESVKAPAVREQVG